MSEPGSLTIAQRAAAYAALSERHAPDVQREVQIVSRLGRIDPATRTVRAIAYPAWDPPAAGSGTVSRADFDRYVDTWGTFMRPETVRELAAQWLQAGARMDVDHSEIPDAIHPTESLIVRDGDPDFGDWVGSWAVASRVYSDTSWQRVERDDLNGYSIMVYCSFRAVEVDVVDEDGSVERATIGEFVKPYPKFLSLVGSPAIREGFRSTPANSDEAPQPPAGPTLHVVRCASRAGDVMSETAAPTATKPADGAAPAPTVEPPAARAEGDEMGLFKRFASWWAGKGAEDVKREQLVARAHTAVAEEFNKIEPRYLTRAITEALEWSVCTITWDDDLDGEGKRLAIIDAFAQALGIAQTRLTATMIDEMATTVQRSDVEAASVERSIEALVARKGAKIAKARLDKLTVARDTLTDIIDEATSEEARSAEGGAPTPGDSGASGADVAASGEPSTEETDMTEAERKQMQDEMAALRADNAAMRAELAAATTETEPETEPEPATPDVAAMREELEAIRAEQAELKTQIARFKAAPGAPQAGGGGEHSAGAQVKRGDVAHNGKTVNWAGTF